MVRNQDVFLPSPQKWSRQPGGLTLSGEVPIRSESSSSSAPAVAWLETQLRSHGLRPVTDGVGPGIELVLDASLKDPESYRLRVSGAGMRVEGADTHGLFYGAVTLAQWWSHGSEPLEEGTLRVPGLTVEDAPSFSARGVMLDVSRDKVPTLETLFSLIDRFAGWKINQLQLYLEHTFAYRGHEVVWKDASPYSAEDFRQLDDYCRQRCIELVPNQNSFGHFHRWLRHEPYRQLSEVPEGVKHPFGEEIEPFSLCPGDPGSLELLGDLYDQLLPNFRSRLVNVGCDETFDLGLGRSAEACEEKGKERVYLEFLHRVDRLVQERGHRMQFWGDIIVQRPELFAELPKEAIALEWGYESDHPFAEHGAQFAASGLEFYVCPGTSSWNSLAGRSDNTVANLVSAARQGRAHGAAGYLITDWGDFGHLQPLSASYLGFAVGAALAWNAEPRAPLEKEHLAALLDLQVFHGEAPGLGRILYDLGNVYKLPGAVPKNGSALFFLLIFSQETLEHRRFDGLSEEGLQKSRTVLAEISGRLRELQTGSSRGALVQAELLWVSDLLTLGADLGTARLQAGRDQPLEAVPAEVRRTLASRLEPLLERHSEIWSVRNRPGGLQDSQQRLRRLAELLSAENELSPTISDEAQS
ncbi:MAG: family 20 glycosylhydrolase [Deltaproteobacteria bacterium]|nr:family 20 glycosylhydrolase [Deltaproteobacteria bacterium]